MAAQNVKKAFAHITDYNPSFKTIHAFRLYATGKLESCLRKLCFGEIETEVAISGLHVCRNSNSRKFTTRDDLFINLLIQSLFPYNCRGYTHSHSWVFERYAVQNA